MNDPYILILQCVFGGKPPEGASTTEEEQSVIRYVLATLTLREERIIKQRFFEGKSLGEVAELTRNTQAGKDGVTRERVRQLEKAAFRKLRHQSRRKELEPVAKRLGLI